jgi:hypothetical protein
MADVTNALGLVVSDISKNAAKVAAFQQQVAAATTYYTLTLKPVQNGPFSAVYDLIVSDLQLPKQVDLSL